MSKKDRKLPQNPNQTGYNFSNEKKKQGAPRKPETEKRTKRVQTIFNQQVYDDLRALSEIRSTSLNNLLHTLSEEAIEENKDLIKAYRELQEKAQS